jgi:hypothetical protein
MKNKQKEWHPATKPLNLFAALEFGLLVHFLEWKGRLL